MPATNHRIARVLKALEGYGKDQWISDADLATLSDESINDVRDTMNSAATSTKYEGVVEREGHPGAWRYRLIGDIDWETVGNRAGSKNGHKARLLGKPILEWAQARGNRSPFSMAAVCKAIKIDNNQARPALGRLVQKGQLVVVDVDAWRLADDVELTTKEGGQATMPTGRLRPVEPEHVVRPDHFVQEPVASGLNLLDALRMAQTAPKAKRTLDECVAAALEAIADGETFSVQKLQALLPQVLAFQEAAKRLYKSIHNLKD